jgi:large subunit ribosomal protein L4
MATAKVYTKDGTETGTMQLPDSLFGCKVNEDAIHRAVVTYQANQRLGTAWAKEKRDVSGGGRKPFRQKGTGRARAGSIRSPLWRGGGVVFGPQPRSYNQQIPKKVKRLALKSSLSSRAKNGDVIVIEALEFAEPKTKQFVSILRNIDAAKKKMLVVIAKPSEATVKSARNVPGIKVEQASLVNTYDVMWADKILLTTGAIIAMEEVFA